MRRASSRVSGSHSSEWHWVPDGRERGKGANMEWRCLEDAGSVSRRRSKFLRTAERPDDANSCTWPEEGVQRLSGSWLPWWEMKRSSRSMHRCHKYYYFRAAWLGSCRSLDDGYEQKEELANIRYSLNRGKHMNGRALIAVSLGANHPQNS